MAAEKQRHNSEDREIDDGEVQRCSQRQGIPASPSTGHSPTPALQLANSRLEGLLEAVRGSI